MNASSVRVRVYKAFDLTPML